MLNTHNGKEMLFLARFVEASGYMQAVPSDRAMQEESQLTVCKGKWRVRAKGEARESSSDQASAPKIAFSCMLIRGLIYLYILHCCDPFTSPNST